MKGLTLTDLIDIETLQNFQDGFSRFTGMACLTTDAQGNPVTKGSGFTNFCMNLNRKTSLGYERCKSCDKMGAEKTLEMGRGVSYVCHAGLMDFSAPIMLNNEILGNIIGGQVRGHNLDEDSMKRTALELGIDEDLYLQEAYKVPELDSAEVEKSAIFLGEIASTISKMAYNNYQALLRSHKMEKSSRSQLLFIQNSTAKIYDGLKTLSSRIASLKPKIIDEEIYEDITKIDESINDLFDDVEDTINYVSLTQGKVELKESVYTVRTTFSHLIRKNLDYLKFKGFDIDMKLLVYDNVPERLLGDIGKIGHIITRLLTACVTFGNVHNIEITISTRSVDYSKNLIIEIRDDGDAITPSELLDIQKYLSTGLSLYIDKSESSRQGFPLLNILARQISGSIELDRNVDKGMKVTLRFPQLEIKENIDEL